MVKIQVCVLYDYILDTEIEENKNREREGELVSPSLRASDFRNGNRELLSVIARSVWTLGGMS